jgi:hypothetical protein
MLLFTSNHAFADSPLTSTEIYKAYDKLPIIQLAGNSKGLLTEELIKYLVDTGNPTDVKIALINRLGWHIKGKKNASIFIKYLRSKYGYKTAADLTTGLSASDLICIAYLKSMDYVYKSYCQVFKIVDEVRTDENLTMDFNKEASAIIFDYIDGYKKYCTN